MCDIGKLMRTDVELFCEDSPVADCLIQHQDEIAVLKDVFHFL